MGKKKKKFLKAPAEAEVVAAEVSEETEVPEEEVANIEPVEETIVEKTEQEPEKEESVPEVIPEESQELETQEESVTEAELPEEDGYVTESFDEPEEDPGETKVLTNEIRAALEEQEEEEIVDAKIRQGISEAADQFRNEQELDLAGESIAEELSQTPPQAAMYYNQQQGSQYTNAQYQNPANTGYAYTNNQKVNNQRPYTNTKKGIKKMDEYNAREEAEVKTVYIKEKQKTGWWKIVMLVLTIIIAIAFSLTALFAGIGAWQVSRIADNQTANVYAYPGVGEADPYEDYYTENPNSSGSISDSYDDYEDVDLRDILNYFGLDDTEGYGDYEGNYGYEDIYNNEKPGNNNGAQGNENNTSAKDSVNSIVDWFSDLFGDSESSQQNGNQTY